MNKKLASLLSGFLVIPIASAASLQPLEYMGDLLVRIGSFVWISDKISATKFALFIVIFAIIYTILAKGMGSKGTAIFDKSGGNKVSAVIAFSLALISVLFIPNSLVLNIGGLYSGTFAFLIVMFPIALIMYFVFLITREDPAKFLGRDVDSGTIHISSERARHITRAIASLLLCLVILGLMKDFSQFGSQALIVGGYFGTRR